MKNFKRIIALAVVVILVVALCAGCTSSSGGSTLDKIKQSGKLVMLTNAAFPPYEYLGADNEAAGVDVDICQAIADEIGVELEVVNMDFDSLIAALQAGKGDIVAAGLTVTDERKEAVDFSEVYASATQYIIKRADDTSITSLDDLATKVVGVQLGTTGDIYMSDDGMCAEIKQYKNGLEGGQALANGAIDALVIDALPAENICASVDGLELITEAAFGEEYYALAVAKGNDDFLEIINSVVTELYEDGTVAEWNEEHAIAFQDIG